MLASVVLIVLSVCVAHSNAAMEGSQVTMCSAIAAAIPELTTLSSSPWNTNNLQACTAQGITCNAGGFVTSIQVSGLTSPVAIPSTFPALTALTSFSMDAPFTGQLPSSLPASLVSLTLSNAQLSGTIPSGWESATSLVTLTLSFSRDSTDAIVFPTSLISQLTSVELKRPYFDGFPTALYTSSSIQTIIVSEARIQDGSLIPSAVWNNAVVQTFYLTADLSFGTYGMGSTIPYTYASMTSLQSFTLGGCDSVGGLPSAWPSGLLSVDFSNNQNTFGPLPTALLGLSSLTSFSLSSMVGITGSFPVPTTSSINTIAYNNLPCTGSIPSNILTSLPSLTQLTISNNAQMTGPLPADDANSNLQYLNFTGNPGLTGTVPSYTMSNLFTIIIDNNGITGPIPSTFPMTITYLSISDNPTTGTIPSISFKWSPISPALLLRNAGLTGTIPTALGAGLSNDYYLFDLSGNDLDMCANAGTDEQATLVSRISSPTTCNLTTTTDSEAGCSTAWPVTCFDYVPVFTPVTPPVEPTAVPTVVPTAVPNAAPTAGPSVEPTAAPSDSPIAPTSMPTAVPTITPRTLDVPIGAASSISVSMVLVLLVLAFVSLL